MLRFSALQELYSTFCLFIFPTFSCIIINNKGCNAMLKFEKGFTSVNKTFRIPVNIVEQLEQLAGEYNTSMNRIVVQCLQYALENSTAGESNEVPAD